jgi:hypothetical protein
MKHCMGMKHHLMHHCMKNGMKKRLAMRIASVMAEMPIARIPSPVFLAGACISMILSMVLFIKDKKHESLFVGQWAPTFLILGIYRKLLRLAGF